VSGRAYAGADWDWLTPFSLTTGVALVFGYALLGSTWLVLKTEGDLQARAVRYARVAGALTLLMIVMVSIWTPFLHEGFMAKWFAWPAMLFVLPVPLLVAFCAIGLFRGLARGKELSPFLYAEALFVLSFIGLVISFFPYMVPSSVTLWDAAGPDKSLAFLLAGAVFLIPIILAYTAYSYWVFRGKVGETSHYHG